MSEPTRLRCAVYTRKSSEEGLDQTFNSLHAQREACEAYIQSQVHEGWRLVKTAYDDGGFSGGSMDRPGLRALIADIEKGAIDVVVVYKVDRLTRSLTDFGRIIERFDAKKASFVSVTQAFNTTTSMGRLTLNVLLSFAQFEREVTGERIRDKIKASKAKGMWMGGIVPLGYDARDRTLVPNLPESECVQAIFQRYLSVGSVHRLADALRNDGIRSKCWTTVKGRVLGGHPFSRGQLYHLLQNRLYVGEIRHRDQHHPGLHPAIVDQALFDAVQEQLGAQRCQRKARVSSVSSSILKGRVFDAEGVPMSPAAATGRQRGKYRYYVSSGLQRGQRSQNTNVLRRIAAKPLEALVLDRMSRWMSLTAAASRAALIEPIMRIDLNSHAVTIHLPPLNGGRLALAEARARLDTEDAVDCVDQGGIRLTISIRSIQRGGKTWLVAPGGKPADGATRHDLKLIEALMAAHRRLQDVGASPLSALSKVTASAGISHRYERRIVRLAFLAPDIQCAILEGRQPPGLTLKRLTTSDIPLSWSEQAAVFGF